MTHVAKEELQNEKNLTGRIKSLAQNAVCTKDGSHICGVSLNSKNASEYSSKMTHTNHSKAGHVGLGEARKYYVGDKIMH